MCQRRQNSVIESDVYGMRKLRGKVNPSTTPNPIAMFE